MVDLKVRTGGSEEPGIITYPDAVQKMDAVVGKVSELLLPTMVN